MTYRRKYRTVVFYKKHFERFFLKQTAKVREKIIWTFELINGFQKKDQKTPREEIDKALNIMKEYFNEK